MNDAHIRLQKFLAERGIGSRRACETMIEAGHVKVNGITITKLGTKVDPVNDKVLFDDTPLSCSKEKRRTIILNKPRGYICSTKAYNDKTIYELLAGIKERLVSVGRLDKDSEGLLIMSNDGELVNNFSHPEFDHEKRYEVTVSGKVTDEIVAKLQTRLVIDGYQIQPVKVRILRDADRPDRKVLEFRLKEGRNRQIRKMCDQVDLRIHRLKRKQIDNITLGNLKPGEWKDIVLETKKG